MPDALYDQIGQAYAATRHPDPRIAAAIVAVLGNADTMVNVGAGAGAYEPIGKRLIGVEPIVADDSAEVASRVPGSPGGGRGAALSSGYVRRRSCSADTAPLDRLAPGPR